METERLSTIIVDVIQQYDNVRYDFLQRKMKKRYRKIMPNQFHTVRTILASLENGTYNLPDDCLGVIAVNDTSLSDVKHVYLYDGNYYFDRNESIEQIDYMTDNSLIGRKMGLQKYRFTEDLMNGKINIYTSEPKVLIFYNSFYKTQDDEIVIPEVVVDYMTAYGEFICEEISMNHVLRGRYPASAVQTRKFYDEKKKRVSNEYKSMARKMNLMLDDVVIKEVEHAI